MIHLTDIEKKVIERYPVTDKEKNCKVEKNKRDWLREEYKKELSEISKRIYENQPET